MSAMKRRWLWKAASAATALACLPACQGSEGGAPVDAAGKYDPELVAAVSRSETRVLVTLADWETDRPTHDPKAFHAVANHRRSLLAARLHPNLRLERAFEHLPVVVMQVSGPEALAELAARPEVSHIDAERFYEPTLTQSLAMIRQDVVSSLGDGFQGEDTYVAVLDTGLDYTRSAFGSCAPVGTSSGVTTLGGDGCRVWGVLDTAPNDNFLDDDRGNKHGTNVAGIVASVAPKTKLLGVDVMTWDGVLNADRGSGTHIVAALDKVLALKSAGMNFVAVNMSLGSEKMTAPCANDYFAAAIGTLRNAGILSAVAAGNNGWTSATASPACVPTAVSVGAVYDQSGIPGITPASVLGNVTPFSNAAPYLTLMAPGSLITAAGIVMQGTSQAAPHVAGAIAVLAGAFPEESPAQLVDRLTKTGLTVTDQRVKSKAPSYPMLDLAASVYRPSTTVSVGGVVTSFVASEGSATASFQFNAERGDNLVGACVSTTRGSCSGTWTDVSGSAGTAFTATVSGVTTPSVTKKVPAVVYPMLKWKQGAAEAVLSTAPVSFTFDGTAPTAGKVTVTGTGKTREALVSWTEFKDTGSGVATYRVFLGTKPAKCSDAGSVAQVAGSERTALVTNELFATGTAKKLVDVHVCAIDRVGNGSASAKGTGFATPEDDAPVGSATIGDGQTGTLTAAAQNVTITATDASTVTHYCLTTTNAACTAWKPLTGATGTWTLSNVTLPQGSLAVWLRDAWDNAGPIDIEPSPVFVDSVVPSDKTLTAAKAGTACSAPRNVRVSFSFTDVTSDITKVRFVQETGTTPAANCTGAKESDILTVTGGKSVSGAICWYFPPGMKTTVRACAVDAVGNVSKGKTASLTP